MKKSYLLILVLVLFAFASCTQNKPLRILSYNIHNAIGMDDVTDYKRIADVITTINPDVVALQELDSVTQRSKGVYVLEEIGKHAGMNYTFGSAIHYQGGKYGIGILSKEKPLTTRTFPLPGREEERVLLIAEFKDYVFCCTHFSLTPEDRYTSVAIINEQIQHYKKPVFLAGDLNAYPDSETVVELKKDWNILNDISKNTFSSTNPRRCIDYILSDSEVKVADKQVVDEKIASDHLPVYVDIEF